MSKHSDVKNGHFVPRVYLKSFADNDYKVKCLFKQSGQIRHIVIDKICTKRYMYAKTGEDGKIDNSIEHMFSDFESTVLRDTIDEIKSLPYNVMYGNYCTHIADTIKPKIIRMILVQLLRGLKLKDQITDYASKVYHQKYDDEDRLLKKNNSELYDYIKRRESSIINDTAPEIASKPICDDFEEDILSEVLSNMVCTILYIGDNGEFVTSDNPVLIYGNSPNDVGLMRVPLIYNKTIICYPISPKIAVVFSWGHVFDRSCRSDGVIKLDKKDSRIIEQLNLGQYNQSSNCIVARSEDPLKTLVSDS